MTEPIPRPDARFVQSDAAYSADVNFLSGVLAASRDCITVFDRDGHLLFINAVGCTLLDIEDIEAVRFCSWEKFWLGNADARAALATAQAGGSAQFSAIRDGFGGTPRRWEVQLSPLTAATGQPERLLAVSREVDAPATPSARHDESLELNHRIKNQMAVVQSIVNQTLRGAYPPETAKQMIAARLDVLARTHDLLIHSADQRVPVRAIVDATIHRLDSRRVMLSGADMVVGSKAALSLALILHELTSNAIAHGAFSVPHGRAEIVWTQSHWEGQPAFELSFAESGGPPVTPPLSRGFGARLLQGGLSGSASQASLDFHPDGVRFRLTATLATVVAPH